MKRLDLLKQMSFGSQIAEEEVNHLADYFVETNQWQKIANGEIDIVRGEKGAGKSAIYALLTTRVDDFFDRGILLVAAENPRGATVFKDLVADSRLRRHSKSRSDIAEDFFARRYLETHY